MFPIPTDTALIQDMLVNNEYACNNFIPFKTIISCILSIREFNGVILVFTQIFGNIIIFVPLGTTIFLFNKNIKKRYVILLGCVVSLMVESFQYILDLSLGINFRSVDVDDLILNTLGCFMGFYCVRYFAEHRKAFKNIYNKVISFKLFKKKSTVN